jgi:hypothetical protein
MIRALLLLLALALAGPAEAHKLKVFATVEGAEVTGYAFFVGGGRPQGAAWIVTDGAGSEIARGETDAAGGFRAAVPQPVSSAITAKAMSPASPCRPNASAASAPHRRPPRRPPPRRRRPAMRLPRWNWPSSARWRR